MKKLIYPSLVVISLFAANAHAADNKPCPFSTEYLSQQLGIKLKLVTQMPALLGTGCEYADDNRTIKIAVDAGPNPAPSADAWRKMSNPPGTKWKSIAGDPDKAVVLDKASSGEIFPSLSYERKSWLVQINVMGIKGDAKIAEWNNKLLKLKRLPE